MRAAGTQVYYRLGASIEHWSKKYGILPPPDFAKWARICEHVIMHYNEGWANGFHWNIEYWEIWNEPDLDPDDGPNKRCWGGTKAQFFELYSVTATYLKSRFPAIKVGGPAIAGKIAWGTEFIEYMAKNNIPLDFYSWHRYAVDVKQITDLCTLWRKTLDDNGLFKTESILNEWNYVRNWNTEWLYSIEKMTGMKGAAFAMSAMLSGQNSVVDMLMYYDARTGTWYNGIFDFYTQQPLKTFYDFVVWSKLMDLGKQFELNVDAGEGIRAVGATDENGKAGIALCRYFEQDEMPAEIPVTIRIKGKKFTSATALLLDEDNDLTETSCTCNADGSVTFYMKGNSVVYVEG